MNIKKILLIEDEPIIHKYFIDIFWIENIIIKLYGIDNINEILSCKYVFIDRDTPFMNNWNYHENFLLNFEKIIESNLFYEELLWKIFFISGERLNNEFIINKIILLLEKYKIIQSREMRIYYEEILKNNIYWKSNKDIYDKIKRWLT